MLAMADTPINQFLPTFAKAGVPVAFLVPTPTSYEKSIMDATTPVRDLLLKTKLHDYNMQQQGPANKVIIKSFFVKPDSLVESSASLYRPVTKQGDPRIWFTQLKTYCHPCNLLALIVLNKEIYVFNLSNQAIADSLLLGGYAADILNEAINNEKIIADELLNKIKAVHNLGYIRSITEGDPGVGDTLENALNIYRNNSKKPDYKGIELKATRLSRNGERRATTRSTLFTKVPDVGMTYREIVNHYGKRQIPRGSTEARLQLYETLRVSRPNAYDLILDVDIDKDKLEMLYQKNELRKFVSAWYLQTLRETLLTKHHETFWVKAVSITRDGWEYFRYDRILHTKNPNTSLFAPLLETDKITVDLAAHYMLNGKYRDHGVLFKMNPEDIPLLLGEPVEYIL